MFWFCKLRISFFFLALENMLIRETGKIKNIFRKSKVKDKSSAGWVLAEPSLGISLYCQSIKNPSFSFHFSLHWTLTSIKEIKESCFLLSFIWDSFKLQEMARSSAI
eukprot:TRINITY_DN105409_c0_g1_i1.p1 TRINITY_DN105409_c0_g1~~TRINITY_DN105409_c0_g1_i1.p1  ORF type:complete len:107 (+),score=9.40 TRINITY_DN105409_c0_g1_i1:388-708(+)